MAGRIVRLITIMFMALWVTGKILPLAPVLAIPLIGASVAFCINEVQEIRHDNIKNKKTKKVNKKAKSTKS